MKLIMLYIQYFLFQIVNTNFKKLKSVCINFYTYTFLHIINPTIKYKIQVPYSTTKNSKNLSFSNLKALRALLILLPIWY